MAQSSPLDLLESQIRECYGRIVWTHKTQEKCADIIGSLGNRMKLLQILLSAITTSGIFVSVLGDCKAAGYMSAFVSLMLLVLNTYLKKYDLGGLAQKHADAAVSLWGIRESYFSLLTDIRCGASTIEDARAIRDKLQSDTLKVYRGAPRTISKAYRQATKALKKMEEMTFSDEEIDKFLPLQLRSRRAE